MGYFKCLIHYIGFAVYLFWYATVWHLEATPSIYYVVSIPAGKTTPPVRNFNIPGIFRFDRFIRISYNTSCVGRFEINTLRLISKEAHKYLLLRDETTLPQIISRKPKYNVVLYSSIYEVYINIPTMKVYLLLCI